MHLAPNMYKMVTLNANAKEIITLKCIWHQICTKLVTLNANAKKIITLKVAFGTTYVQNHYFEGKC